LLNRQRSIDSFFKSSKPTQPPKDKDDDDAATNNKKRKADDITPDPPTEVSATSSPAKRPKPSPTAPASIDPIVQEQLTNFVNESSWRPFIEAEAVKPYFVQLAQFLQQERKSHTIFPSPENTFTAFNMCPINQIKVQCQHSLLCL